MQWFLPGNTGDTSIKTKVWNYSGNPVATTVTTTPVMLLQPTNSIRAISYSASATSGTIIKLWLNADAINEPPQLRSCDGHNLINWVFTGTLVAAVDVGSAVITIDIASEQTL